MPLRFSNGLGLTTAPVIMLRVSEVSTLRTRRLREKVISIASYGRKRCSSSGKETSALTAALLTHPSRRIRGFTYLENRYPEALRSA